MLTLWAMVTFSSSASPSLCGVTVTVCARFQVVGVKVRGALAPGVPPDLWTFTAPASPLVAVTVTLAVGLACSLTV